MPQKPAKRRSCNLHLDKIIGGILTIFGLWLLFDVDKIHELLIKTAMAVYEGSPAYNGWIKTDPPLTMDAYFFNWTNSEDLFNVSVKPRFEEVGPYRFKEVHEKHNITFDGDTVSYDQLRRYYFDENSPRQLNDSIYTINSLAVSAAYQARYYSSFKKFLVAVSLTSTSDLRLERTVDQLLFAGYNDKFLTMVRPMANSLNMQLNDKYGYYYNRNGTHGLNGHYKVHIKHDEHFGRLLQWNGKNFTNFFEGPCNEIKDSVGDFYPLNKKNDTLKMFTADTCGNLEFQYEKNVLFKGINTYKFTGEHVFDNGKKSKKNSCFCNEGCGPSGVRNVTTCRMGAPIFLSLPHFYGADSYYRDIIEGMKPEKSKHDFSVIMEPKTSVLVDVTARMQVNILLEPVPGISMFQKVPRIYFPIFYVSEQTNLSDEVIYGVKLLQNLPQIINIVAIIITIIGVLIPTVPLMITLWKQATNRSREFQRCPTDEPHDKSIPLMKCDNVNS